MSAPPLRHRLELTTFRAVRWAWSVLPEPVAIRLAALTGFVAATVLRIRRRDVDRHLRIAFPERSASWRRRVARACYVHLCREVATMVRIPRWSGEELLDRVRFEAADQLRSAAEEGRGAVLLTAHHGNWELAGAVVAAMGIELDVVGKGMANRAFEADLIETRERMGMRVIDMMDAPKEVIRSLRRGGVVAMLADQNAHRSDLFVPFFGRPAATARGPALFALRTGAPIFFGVTVREPGWAQRYRIDMRRLDLVPSGDAEADAVSLLSAYAEALERAIEAAPEQYFWHHRRWRTRPGR